MMGQILSLAETMREMIDDLLIYSRVERREITQHPVQIRQVVAERQADLQAGAVETVIDLPFDKIIADEEGMAWPCATCWTTPSSSAATSARHASRSAGGMTAPGACCGCAITTWVLT